jgi:Ca-activated chloride channel family protein
MNVSIASKISERHLVFRLRTTCESTLRPLHIGILLDNSGSMEGSRLESVKRTLHAARPLLQFGDRLTLVSFSDTATIHLRAVTLSNETDMASAYNRVDNIHAESSTNLGAGIEALYSVATDYNAVILLTDGMVNAGITSTAGLRAMAQAGGATLAFHTIGYGADHNRTLLRELAVRSRGTYTYADSDEILPLAVGDILSGLRAEVVWGVHLQIPEACGWACQEIGAQSVLGYYVGHMIAGRDYWAVYQRRGVPGVAGGAGVLMATVEAANGERQSVSIGEGEGLISDQDMEDQVLRARVAAALEEVTGQLEAGEQHPDTTALSNLQIEFLLLPARPLLMRLRAQVAEVLDIALRVVSAAAAAGASRQQAFMFGGAPTSIRQRATGVWDNATPDTLLRTHLMARMSSGVACLGNQRGVYSMAPAEGEEDTNTSFFSTPTQRTASNATRATYTPRAGAASAPAALPQDPDANAPMEPIVQTAPMEEID